MGFHQIPADAEQLHHVLGKSGPIEPGDLVRLARRMGARSSIGRVSLSRLQSISLPVVAHGRYGAFLLLAGARDGDVLVHDCASPQKTISVTELDSIWDGQLVLVTTRAEQSAPGKFDVTWFAPALVKYRELLGEVLLASLVIQLFGLATPLIFQVLIDKVLVYKGMTMLDVLALGLVARWCATASSRAYVLTHTTGRVDVELGAKLYRHLLALPLAYFQSRRVGDSVARVRELDTIREFLTSSSVTLLIDLL